MSVMVIMTVETTAMKRIVVTVSCSGVCILSAGTDS